VVLDALDALTAAQDRYNDSVRDGAETVADLFTSIVDGSKSAVEALADLLAQLAQVQIQKAFLGLAEGGGFFGSAFSSLGSALSVPVGTNAQGTDFWRGGLTWVGEQGPEIVNLPRGAQVFDAATSRRMAAGGGERQAVSITNHYTIDARGAEAGVEAKIARAIEAQNRMLPDIIKRTLRDPRRR
jgi:phage-related protein